MKGAKKIEGVFVLFVCAFFGDLYTLIVDVAAATNSTHT